MEQPVLLMEVLFMVQVLLEQTFYDKIRLDT
jgi:hypothetical protein